MSSQSVSAPSRVDRDPGDPPKVMLFSVLKPFVGETDGHQRNALASWKALEPDLQIVLFSDSPIPSDIRSDFHCADVVRTNHLGTPLLDEIFHVAAEWSRARVRAFVNADIILDRRFVEAAHALSQSSLDSWLAVGQRTEFDVSDEIDREDDRWVSNCFEQIEEHGTLASAVCKDYFLFTDDLFREIPAFAIGRGNWDNWMVSSAKRWGVPVVDIGQVAPVIHQQHGYDHVRGGRRTVYVSGPEARENQRLAGGRNLISGSTPNWKLGRKGLRKNRAATLSFGRDLVRFSSLLGRLFLPTRDAPDPSYQGSLRRKPR